MRLACTALSSWFEKGATIVTPSRLTAAVAAQQFTKHQLDHGLESWQRTAVSSVTAWLLALWSEARYKLSDVPTLLSDSQEHVLWQQIIEQEHANLFDIPSTARLAMRTGKLIAEWQIPTEGDSWSDHEDAQQFQAWRRLFRRKCHEYGWITRSDLWRLLPNWIAAGVGSRELTVFAGFRTVTPALEQVQQVLGSRAVRENVRAAGVAGRVPAMSYADFAQEIEHAARWSRAIFEERPASSIGIFVPDLATNRSLVERTFRQVFYPSAALRPFEARLGEQDSVFHVNAGADLRAHPLIASGLLLLELGRPRMQIGDAGAILRSPFIAGAAAERSERALADFELRKRRGLEVEVRDLECSSARCPLLAPVWRRVRRVLSNTPREGEPPHWSEFFADILDAAGWPGEGEISTQEQEITEKWKQALSTLAALGLVCGKISYDDAIAHLRRLLSAPGIERGEWSSPVQILDASAAAGLEFDAVFVTGLSDETWPPPLNSYPLVPLKLQRASHVPTSSPENAQRERECMTESLFASAPVTMATYSGRLSGLAARFVTPARTELIEWQGKLPRQSYMPIALDEVEDTTAPRYKQNEGTRGGASLIKAQSLCPFRAFAEFRLGAKMPEDGCLGFDSRERGGFVHDALRNVWNHLKTSQQLLATPHDKLRVIIQDAVEEAVRNSDPGPFEQLISRTERERLEKVIEEWLDVERARKQPFSVEAAEQDRFHDFPGLRLRLRVDRLDRLRNGKLVLIDYKSGQQTRGKLKCPRPAEPQLLVYATAIGSDVDGVFFGELKAREPRAVGFSREKHFPGLAAGVNRDWDLFLAESEDEVERLAAEFVRGHAAVDPIKTACEYCRLKPFCRVNENARQEQDSE